MAVMEEGLLVFLLKGTLINTLLFLQVNPK